MVLPHSKDYLLSDLRLTPARLAHLMEPAAEMPLAPQQTAQPAAGNPRAPSVARPALTPTQAAPTRAAPSSAAAPEAAPVAAGAPTCRSRPSKRPPRPQPLTSPAPPPPRSLRPRRRRQRRSQLAAAQRFGDQRRAATPSAANIAVATDVVDNPVPDASSSKPWRRPGCACRPDGDVLLSKVMGRGEKFTIPDHPEVLLSTGDAGSVAVFVDGARVADVGRRSNPGRCDLGRGSFGGGQRR